MGNVIRELLLQSNNFTILLFDFFLIGYPLNNNRLLSCLFEVFGRVVTQSFESR